jgi:tetratricopeptide (TPR) repeat protein
MSMSRDLSDDMAPPKNGPRRSLVICHLSFVIGICFAGTFNACTAAKSLAQDVVISSSASDPAARIRRVGQILDYTGAELKLRTSLGTEETIPAVRVIEIETRWSPSHEVGRAARQEGRFDDCLAALRQAKREESRPWAVRQIMADLSGCYLDAGQLDRAGDEFFGIIASDPTTRHFDVIPVAWRGASLSPAAESRAAAWLSVRGIPVANLLGASWLLATRRPDAAVVLDELTRSSDPRVAGLASIQVWRSKLITATSDDLNRWQNQLEKMPAEIQASGWYVLGDILARQEQPQMASLAYLKIPILFRQQRAMAADALLAAAGQLEKMSKSSQAAALYRELASDFPRLPAAIEAQGRLDKLKSAAPHP